MYISRGCKNTVFEKTCDCCYKKYFAELSELPEKKAVLLWQKKYPDKVSLIFAESEKELYDIDMKEDLAKLEEMSADD